MEFHPFAPPLEYQQNDSNYCNFFSLASLLTAFGEVFSKRDIAGQIEESLVCQSKGYSVGSNFLTLSCLKTNKTNDSSVQDIRFSNGR